MLGINRISDAALRFRKEPATNRRRAVLLITEKIDSPTAKGSVRALWESDAVLGQLFALRHDEAIPRLRNTALEAAARLFQPQGQHPVVRLNDEGFLAVRTQDDAETAYFLLSARTAKDQLDEGQRACRSTLSHYQVLENPDWRESAAVQRLAEDERARLNADVGQLLALGPPQPRWGNEMGIGMGLLILGGCGWRARGNFRRWKSQKRRAQPYFTTGEV